ncbi:MAG TPA: amidohydrolase [Armatimonadota bacterium]|nr:amidohydrolase [Armatimonadota bacterium]
MPADLLLLNGHILTLSGRPAAALAVLRDRIIGVGEDDELQPLRGLRTRLIDLRGRLALPGFTDSHVHLGALAKRLSQLRLESASTLAHVLRLVAAHARRQPPGTWIIGVGFDKNRWGDAFPTRADLDPVSSRHPVALRSRDGHTLWVNTLALTTCGITARTPDPAGGLLARDERGRPTGILHERATALIPNLRGFDQPRAAADALLAAQRFLLRQGITSAHLMEETPIFELLQRLRTDGNLLLRSTVYRHADALDEMIAAGLASGFGDEWLRIGGIKLLLDGALGSQTAWMFRPYDNAPAAGCGVPVVPVDALAEIVERAARARIACAIHAIGDRANAETLRALTAVRGDTTPLPHRIEHAQLLRPQDIPRFARLGIVASMQPCHLLGDIDPAERYWGRRSRHAYPLRSLLSSGAALAFGSDAPVETSDPLAGIYAAVMRQTLDGRPPGGWYRREEGIGVLDAVRAYTTGPAAATGEARIKGRLAPGYLADIVVLSRDITRLRSRALLEVEVDLVIVGGRVRYRRRPR